MKVYNNEEIIVSLTSFCNKIQYLPKTLFTIFDNDFKNFHVVVTLAKKDVGFITEDLQLLIDNNLLELLIVDKDLGPHTKYFYAMEKYQNKPIITFDDDRKIHKNAISLLLEGHKNNPTNIIGMCCVKMTKTNNTLNKLSDWMKPYNRLKPNETSKIAMAEGYAGVLYPENFFQFIKNKNELEFEDFKYDDDLYLKMIETRNNLQVTQVNRAWLDSDIGPLNIEETQQWSLTKNINKGWENRNRLSIKYSSELLKAFI